MTKIGYMLKLRTWDAALVLSSWSRKKTLLPKVNIGKEARKIVHCHDEKTSNFGEWREEVGSSEKRTRTRTHSASLQERNSPDVCHDVIASILCAFKSQALAKRLDWLYEVR